MKGFMKFLMLQALFICAIFGTATNVYADEVKQKELYTLENPTWFKKTGFSKGLGHDKQDLGIILPANVQLTIRQVNPNFKGNLTVRLLNDNNQHETSRTFNQTSITISTPYSSVPFVDTVYGGSEKPKIEYRVTSSMQTLPIYKKGQNEQSFFNEWDKAAAPFALVKDDYFQLLVPQKDKAYMKNMKDFSSIDQLILYYREIFEYYNKLAGISFNTNVQTDKNVPNKYFIKADKSGPGGGYYGGNHTAETSDSVASFWLTKGWGALHEIGHGYQDDFTRGEVWNNIYAHSLQKKDSDVDIFKNGWLYDYGKKDAVDYNVNKLWHQDKAAFNTWGLREQLYGYVLMKDKAGDDSFTHFNQEYRKLANTSGFNTSDYKQFDLISKCYGEISKLDFTPVIESFGGTMTDWQKEENRYKNYKPVAPLNEVVPVSQVSQIQQSLKLETPLSLVTTEDLAATDLTGDVTLNFKIDDFNQIKNQTLYIMNGEKEVKKVVITNPTLSLGQLPVGIYTIYSTNSSNKLYTLDNHYLKVKEANNNITLNYKLRTKSTLVNQEIDFLGISDNLFATATVDLQNEKLNVKVLNKTPHDYFPNEQYAKIEILDQNNNVTYTKVITGTNAALENSSQTLKKGYKIRLYHREPSRLKIRDNKTVLTNNQTNTLIVTSQGLKNENLNQNLNQELAGRIDSFAAKINAENLMAKSDCAESKIELKLAIDALTEPLRSEMLTKYKDLLPNSTINKENPYLGKKFNATFKGLGDWIFAELNLDLTSKQAKIDIKKGEPHVYFSDTYASILIRSAEGNTVYTKDFIGDKENETLIKNIDIKPGYYITIKHQEPDNRLLITNTENELELEKGNSITYKITDTGLVKSSEDEINKSPENEWNPNKSYNAGDKVSYKEKTYKAKWWSQGFAPDTKVQNPWETPWELIS
ncbi:putative mucin/carbohydrate-binding domain-containing protein [Clostridium botulinum]|uniref:Viral enhancin protein n=1 Tax=Clostridium botulinum (strain Kyoto / Type A2) TaxID=536232 RepID=C1FQB1_CLOBJ|nr:putative mucin/carbohydrate-binding domain-containing protein [Clostridium botulinum]ACO84629.1 viral enhancin protein [Clostridium botulinum A2 str. Kyoto]AUN07236.1 enhancing factor [Clostridium botulinum]MBN3364498.1 enhancing factor [Clostridium botulinum]MBN3374123.1 enhancing factor [Clostridium botulinum]MBN3385254.1 enhancing factor [Clostridium botulinum]